MTRILVTERAKQDLRDILTDLNRRAGHVVASRYAADFKNIYKRLIRFPARGRRACRSAPRLALNSSTRTLSSTITTPTPTPR